MVLKSMIIDNVRKEIRKTVILTRSVTVFLAANYLSTLTNTVTNGVGSFLLEKCPVVKVTGKIYKHHNLITLLT